MFANMYMPWVTKVRQVMWFLSLQHTMYIGIFSYVIVQSKMANTYDYAKLIWYKLRYMMYYLNDTSIKWFAKIINKYSFKSIISSRYGSKQGMHGLLPREYDSSNKFRFRQLKDSSMDHPISPFWRVSCCYKFSFSFCIMHTIRSVFISIFLFSLVFYLCLNIPLVSIASLS